MKKRVISILFTVCMMVSLVIYTYASDENHKSITYDVVLDVRAEIVNGETGESTGALKIIMNYGDKYNIVELDGTEYEFNRPSTVATFSNHSETVVPEDLTAEEIAAIESAASDIEEEDIPVIVITGFDTMLFANDLVDCTSVGLTTSAKADKDTITGLDYRHGVLVELAYQLSEKNNTSKKLIKSFDKEKVLLKDVEEKISENIKNTQERLEENITSLSQKLQGLDENSTEYTEISEELEAARKKLKETETDAYGNLSNYTPLTILDISMNSVARGMMGEKGYIRLYISIDGVDYDDEIIIVNTHSSDEENAIETVDAAEKAGKKVSDSQIEKIFDQCRVTDAYITPAAVAEDGTVREIAFSEMDDAVLEEGEVLEPRINIKITKTSPFIVLLRNPKTAICSLCHDRSPLFLGLCWHFWLVTLIILLAIIAVIWIIKKYEKKKKETETEAAGKSLETAAP